jgi:light-regulated signal transduction histidine kinase (bacteriophytochrome)
VRNIQKTCSIKIKSVKSINPCISVIQTGYDIVKAHGGEIKIESAQGHGTTFSILLPA